MHTEFAFHGDNCTMMQHVFEGSSPTSKDGNDLLPGILLARALLRSLRSSHTVSHAWLPREDNRSADSLSRTALRRRRSFWQSRHDDWPLPAEYKVVFEIIGQNRKEQCPERCLYECPQRALSVAQSRSLRQDEPKLPCSEDVSGSFSLEWHGRGGPAASRMQEVFRLTGGLGVALPDMDNNLN